MKEERSQEMFQEESEINVENCPHVLIDNVYKSPK